MSHGEAGGIGEVESRALGQARLLAGLLAAGPLVLAAGSVFLPGPRPGLPVFGSLAALAGLVSPLIGYRVYAWLRERVPREATRVERCAGFVRATVASLAVTEGVALVGLVAYWASGVLAALVGVVTHVILVGAVWPIPERLEPFLDDPAEAPGGASE